MATTTSPPPRQPPMVSPNQQIRIAIVPASLPPPSLPSLTLVLPRHSLPSDTSHHTNLSPVRLTFSFCFYPIRLLTHFPRTQHTSSNSMTPSLLSALLPRNRAALPRPTRGVSVRSCSRKSCTSSERSTISTGSVCLSIRSRIQCLCPVHHEVVHFA